MDNDWPEQFRASVGYQQAMAEAARHRAELDAAETLRRADQITARIAMISIFLLLFATVIGPAICQLRTALFGL